MEYVREFFKLNRTTIHVEKYVYGNEGITEADGEKILREIKKRMKIPNFIIQLNFSGLTGISRAFLATIFDGLVFEYPKKEIDERILTRGLTYNHSAFIFEVMRDAARMRYAPYLNSLSLGR